MGLVCHLLFSGLVNCAMILLIHVSRPARVHFSQFPPVPLLTTIRKGHPNSQSKSPFHPEHHCPALKTQYRRKGKKKRGPADKNICTNHMTQVQLLGTRKSGKTKPIHTVVLWFYTYAGVCVALLHQLIIKTIIINVSETSAQDSLVQVVLQWWLFSQGMLGFLRLTIKAD